MRKLPLISLLLITALASAQPGENRALDSLHAAFKNTASAKTSIDIQNAIAVEYYNIDLKKSLAAGQQALERARQLGYDKGVQQALTLLMRVHRRLGNFSVAIAYTLDKLPIAERLKDTLDLIDSYSSLGNIYSSLERYQESGRYLKKAYAMGKMVDVHTLSGIMNFIGRGYGKAGHYDSALHWIHQAMQRERSRPQNDYTLSYIYNNLAEVYYFLDRPDSARHYYDLSLNLPEDRKSQFGLTFSLNGLARVHLKEREYNRAIDAVLKSLLIANENGYRDKTKESYGILHETYEAMGDYRNALQYYKLFNLYQDSIFSEDKLQYIENLKLNFETNRVAKENELLRKDAELKDARIREQRSIAWGAIVAIGSLLVLLLIVYTNYKRKKRTSQSLAEYNENLSTQVEERTTELVQTNLELIRQNNQLEQFGYIIAHNLRAPVARILGLTNLINHGLSMPRDKPVVDKLQNAAEDLDTIIHDLNAILEIKKGVHHSFEHVHIHDRWNKVKEMLREKITECNADIREDLAPGATCYGIPAYMESILYNLISNAIKYRSPGRDVVIRIASVCREENVELVVEDNGMGIDLQKLRDKVFNLYQRFHDHVEGKGIGLFLVKTQVEAMNGKIDLESEPGEGTRFTLLLPGRAAATA